MIFDFYFADVSRRGAARATRRASTSASGSRTRTPPSATSVQRGLRSRAYGAGRLSLRREAGEHLFHRLLAADLRRSGTEALDEPDGRRIPGESIPARELPLSTEHRALRRHSMSTTRRRFLGTAAGAAAALGIPLPASAQTSQPSRPPRRRRLRPRRLRLPPTPEPGARDAGAGALRTISLGRATAHARGAHRAARRSQYPVARREARQFR